ncbi:hypothetical protein MKW98_000937 [Papaver atlanticum]|uniref:F-box domain-containing protein n=1 Tax=Papaver atlanticum TaxID=357466 RepID=A0AAD4XDT3_9MAGN|nr:hypothetical protein MKW98_000937 [Papaver atlanticum]
MAKKMNLIAESTSVDNGDVLFEIFLRLTWRLIFQLRLVSKQWYSILSDPNFISAWVKINDFMPWVTIIYDTTLATRRIISISIHITERERERWHGVQQDLCRGRYYQQQELLRFDLHQHFLAFVRHHYLHLPLGLVGSPSLIQGHSENLDAHSQYYLRLLHVISHHICHLMRELSVGFFREMEKMADTGHQMLQQRINDATNFQYMNGDCCICTTLLMIRGFVD